jgi:GrpB-like predicted nucleotidyltransferase (UPF0157 family)
LRPHPGTAREHASLKYELAERFREDRESYIRAKTGFFSVVVERAKSLRT